jgi:RNA polymerase sigma-70 factor, ECF subfamily
VTGAAGGDVAEGRRDDPELALLRAYVDATDRAERDAAFHVLVDTFERRVHAICWRFFGDHADAEDATQDTFLLLARKAHTFRSDAKVSTWVFQVATNACRDLARKRARRPQTPVGDVTGVLDRADDAPAVDDLAVTAALGDAVRDALDQLDELSRTLVVLCAIEGLPYPEVAATLDLPVGTVKSRVHRARAKLAELLAPALADEPPAPRATPAGDVPTAGAGRTERPRGPPSGTTPV